MANGRLRMTDFGEIQEERGIGKIREYQEIQGNQGGRDIGKFGRAGTFGEMKKNGTLEKFWNAEIFAGIRKKGNWKKYVLVGSSQKSKQIRTFEN